MLWREGAVLLSPFRQISFSGLWPVNLSQETNTNGSTCVVVKCVRCSVRCCAVSVRCCGVRCCLCALLCCALLCGVQREECMSLVANAIKGGIFNDLGSGSNVDLAVITKVWGRERER